MYKYHFDGYIKGRACGWILDVDQPMQRVLLGIFADGQLVKSFYADTFREDILEAGIGDGFCAFEIPIDVSSELDIEVKVLANGMRIAGISKSHLTSDSFVNCVWRSQHFNKYEQFKPENLPAPRRAISLNTKPERLTRAFSQVVAVYEGVAYSEHMLWLCARFKRGIPSFFATKRRDAFDDLFWYLFECRDASKTLAEYDFGYLDQKVYSNFPNMEHHTVLFSLWLHRTGRQLLDIRKNGKEAYLDYHHALISANSSLPSHAGMHSECRVPVGLKFSQTVEGAPPRMTMYLKSKWERGYKELYPFNDLNGYALFLFDSCLHAETHRELALLGQDVLNFFRSPIEVLGGVCSRFALICYALAARAAGKLNANIPNPTATQVNEWFVEVWLAKRPVHNAFMLAAPPLVPKFVHVAACYVVAHWNIGSGLTQNAIMSANTLSEAGIEIVKLLPNGEVFGRVSVRADVAARRMTKDCVLLHVNADEAPAALYALTSVVNLDEAFVIGYFLWELETIPDAHRLGIQLVDEIWAPTEFVEQAYRPLAGAKVKRVGKAIKVPQMKSLDRGRFNLPQEATVFLTSLDFHSSVERKNPIATVLAFLEAFPNRSDVQLVLKSTQAQAGHWGDPFDQWGQLLELAAMDKRIQIIDEFLPEAEVFELIACADVIVSSHRAEGFGYIPAYGLLYGKKVIVTGYGGTSDYCDDTNAWIVPYQLTRVPNDRFVFQVPGAKWADVDVSALALCMQQATKKSKLSAAKRRSVQERFAYAGLSRRYVERLQRAKVIDS